MNKLAVVAVSTAFVFAQFAVGQERQQAKTHSGGMVIKTPDFSRAADNGQQVGFVSAGTKLEVIATQVDPKHATMKWFKVRILSGDLSGKEGWISSTHVEYTKAEADETRGDHLIRSCLVFVAPDFSLVSDKNNQVGMAEKGAEFELISVKDDPKLPLKWYRVRFTSGDLKGKDGWVSTSNVMVTNVRHVTNADGKGWLVVKWDDGSTVPAIPQYLKVEFIKAEGGREYFKVAEGPREGKLASVKQKSDTESYLAPGHPKTAAGTLKFDRKKRQLWYGTAGPVNAKTDDGNPVPLGTHDIEIPDEVHAIGEAYLGDSPHATTWFRIGHAGDRYLHPGQISAGCITVTDTKRWTDIYDYLIKARKGDKKSVAVVEVVE